jgi:hypothetical protein
MTRTNDAIAPTVEVVPMVGTIWNRPLVQSVSLYVNNTLHVSHPLPFEHSSDKLSSGRRVPIIMLPDDWIYPGVSSKGCR